MAASMTERIGVQPIEEEQGDFSHPQTDAFAGANAEEEVGLLRSK
jgi:hypothetical protein